MSLPFFFLVTILLLPCFATPISFNYPNFDRGTDKSDSCYESGVQSICLRGSASVDADSVIQLTLNARDNAGGYQTGIAFYSEPLHLWDNTTGEIVVTNFTSQFSFNISRFNDAGSGLYADGIAFFLSPEPLVNSTNSTGGYFGLVTPPSLYNASGKNSFVAVEFDSIQNQWDPPSPHMGIDVNSIRSVTNISFGPTGTFGGQVQVDYNSAIKQLKVSFNYSSETFPLSLGVDLSDILPEFVCVGFSGTTGEATELNKIMSWSFNSTLDGILGARKKPNTTSSTISPPPPPHEGKSMKKMKKIYVAGGVAIAVLLVLGAACFVTSRLRKKGMDSVPEEMPFHEIEYDSILKEEFPDKEWPQRFTFRSLVDATGNFEEKRKLGFGGSGTVYTGFLKDLNRDVAIKRVSNRDFERGKKEYIAEVKIISQLRHRNLVQLIGWCHERGEFLLVYELMPNLSLERHLFNSEKVLPWSSRYDVALGVASALLYLHEEGQQCVVHRDVKSSNILLDDNFTAKLGDFGLARLTKHGSGLQTTAFGGTLGYIAPECMYTGKASVESDVYSFGIVVLEIATGRQSIESTTTDGMVHLVQWVWDLFGNGAILEAADRKLEANFDKSQMERLLVVGLWCAHPDFHCRPSIRKAAAALNFEDVKIDLPQRMPVIMYATPPAIETNIMQSGTSGISCSSAPATSFGGCSSGILLP